MEPWEILEPNTSEFQSSLALLQVHEYMAAAIKMLRMYELQYEC